MHSLDFPFNIYKQKLYISIFLNFHQQQGQFAVRGPSSFPTYYCISVSCDLLFALNVSLHDTHFLYECLIVSLSVHMSLCNFRYVLHV